MRYKMTISYDGALYDGWQRQANRPSIQEEIEKALCKITQKKVQITGASRTDAGVHALGQIAHFDLEDNVLMNVKDLLRSVNGLLKEDIRVLDLISVPLSFHARFNAVEKIYCYHLHLDPILPPLERHTALHLCYKFSMKHFLEATDLVIGTYDFTSFANTRGSKVSSMERTINAITVVPVKGGIKVYFAGKSFLYKMIRNLMGLFVDVARGKIPLTDISKILDAKDRRKGPSALPGKGLTLIHISY
jgi:tRNA pseudouridine38-40 synthase